MNRRLVTGTMLAGVFAAHVAAATAGAEPPSVPPVDPALVPPATSSPLNPLAQSPVSTGVASPPSLTELFDPQQALAQAPTEAGPTLVNLNPLTNEYVLAQNTEPSAPGDGTIAGRDMGDANANLGYRGVLHRIIDLHRSGDLRGLMPSQRRGAESDGAPVETGPPKIIPETPVNAGGAG